MDFSKQDVDDMQEALFEIGYQYKWGGKNFDPVKVFNAARVIRTKCNSINDFALAVKRVADNTDLEIQKLQILGRKKAEREAAEKLVQDEINACKPEPFSLL